jgi:hypothetical protein
MRYSVTAILALGAILCASTALAMMCEALFDEAQQAYQAGDYDTAVRKAVSALEIEPGYRDAVPFLHKVLPQAYERHLTKLAEYERAYEKDRAAMQYEMLMELANSVKDFPHRFPLPDLQRATPNNN